MLNYLLTTLMIGAIFIASAAESPYGVCAHLNRMPEAEAVKELDGIGEAPIGYVRTDLDWKQVEPEEGKWDFSRWDRIVEEAEKRGVKVLPILCGEMPDFAKPPFRNMDKWLRYVEQCVTRYKGKIDCYEVFNEADCDRPWGEKPDGANYTELLKQTYQLIKRIDPEVRVLFTGVSDFGNPMAFVEAAFRAGAGNYFDVMNFHPYQWKGTPEALLPLRIRGLQALMKKYNIDKPVWITEIGHSSAPDRFPVAKEVVPAALEFLGFSPERDTVGVIADEETLFYTGNIADYLPEWKQLRELTFRDLATVAVQACPVLALPGRESFPASRIDSVIDYVRRGGTVISPGGFPFYFDLTASGVVQIGARHLPRLHMGWETFWVKQGVPNTTTAFEPGEAFPSLQAPHRPSMRFLTAANLKEGDRLIPLLYGVNGAYKAPVAAIYKLDSDLKGNIIVITDTGGSDSVTEEEQAQLLTREYLLAFSGGVEKVFNYRFRAGEWNRGREAHFGIVRRNYAPKPAQEAYAALVRNYPPGSSRPEISIENGIYRARWTQPDGTKRAAYWTTHGRKILSLPSGEIEVTPAVTFGSD